MTFPQRHTPSRAAKRYTIYQLSAMEEDRLTEVLRSDFEALVTISLAAACSQEVPDSIKAMLRSEPWHLDWMDALRCAEGTLQVSGERMAYEEDTRLTANNWRLKACRKAIKDAELNARRFKRHPDDNLKSDPVHTAQQWLFMAYPERGNELKNQVCAEIGADPTQGLKYKFKNVYRRIADAWHDGYINVPATSEVQELVEIDDELFRDLVAEDAKRQNDRVQALRHPLLVGRWSAAVDELLFMTADRAAAASSIHLGPLRLDLWELDPDDVFRVLNARRFFAAVLQRRYEYKSVVRSFATAAAPAEDYLDTASIIRFEAVKRLAAEMPAEYAYVLQRLKRYVQQEGLDPVLFPDGKRGAVKLKVLQELRSGQYKAAGVSGSSLDHSEIADIDVGIVRRVAYALAVMDLEICHRRTIGALASGSAAESVTLERVLRTFEEMGFVQCGEEFIRVLGRGQLYDHAMRGLERLPIQFVDISGAVTSVQRDLDASSRSRAQLWVEQRRLELKRLQQLMESPTSRPPKAVHRTGRQERLEVGEYQRPKKKEQPTFPVQSRKKRP